MNKRKKALLAFGGTKFNWSGQDAYKAAKETVGTTPLNMIFIGDSITYGTDASNIYTTAFVPISM